MTMFCSAWMVVTIPRSRSVEMLPRTLCRCQHPFEGQLSLDAAVRRLIVHFADLTGIIQVGNGRPPVHNHRAQRSRIQDAPAAKIPGFRRAAGGNEIQPGKIGLTGGHMQLAKPVQPGFEKLKGDLLLIIRSDVCMHIHFHAGFGPGERLHIPYFTVDFIAGDLKMKIFFFRGRMIRQCDGFHFFSFPGKTNKPLPNG